MLRTAEAVTRQRVCISAQWKRLHSFENSEIAGVTKSYGTGDAQVMARRGALAPGSMREPMRGNHVAVIGHFLGFEHAAEICNLAILERRPQLDDLPHSACKYIVGETGHRSFDRHHSHQQNHAECFLPSAVTHRL